MLRTYSEYLAAIFRCISFRILNYAKQRNLPITEPEKTRLFSISGMFLVLQVFKFWILRTVKVFQLKIGFCYAQVPFKTGLPVLLCGG